MIKIGNREFKTKTALQKHFSDWLKQKEYGEFFGEGEEFNELCDLVKRHPSASEKIGSGIAAFAIRPHSQYLNKCIWIIRKDGTETDFSYKQCVFAKTASINQRIASAARQAISGEMLKRKKAFFQGLDFAQCELSGVQMSFNECHAHHEGIEFAEIVRKWLYETKTEPSEDLLNSTEDGNDLTEFKDESIASSFSSFHWLVAVIKFVHVDHHVSAHS